MKGLFNFFVFVIITLFIVAACSKEIVEETDHGEYLVKGRVVFVDTVKMEKSLKDSLLQIEAYRDSIDSVGRSFFPVFSFTDRHDTFFTKEIEVKDGRFEIKGMTNDLDEIYVTDETGRTTIIFATPGLETELKIYSDGSVAFAKEDSLNHRFHTSMKRLEKLRDRERKTLIDTLCENHRHWVLPALIIREGMYLMNDSLSLRQSLGRLKDDAKPAWLKKMIEKEFDRSNLKIKKNDRLSPLPNLRAQEDTLFYHLKDTRQNSALVYFWAEYSDEAIDSLKILLPIAKRYGLEEHIETFNGKTKDEKPKRVDIVTICLMAKDSATWLKKIKDVPGRHILLQDGFSNSNIKGWKIPCVPYNLIIDRYSNIQECYLWGEDLRKAIERQPNNFTYQANGSKNNKRRSSRH